MTEYAALISATQESFSIEDDLGAISRIAESIKYSRGIRQKQRQESRGVLLELSRTLEATRQQLSLVQDTRDQDHEELMNALSREKFSLAKDINDVEGQTHHLESQLRQLEVDLNRTNDDVSKEPDAYNHEEGTILRLSVYRDLGIILEEERGVYHSAIIRNAGDTDIHMLKLGVTNNADRIWELCS